jgi:hypothetical protein
MRGESAWLLIVLGAALPVLLLARRRIGAGRRARTRGRGAERTFAEPLRYCGFYYGDPTRRPIRAWDDEPDPPA